MQALILAAGRGSRLGAKTTESPKCLLDIGRRPLIEHQLKTLAEAGIGPVGMVLGYCADEIREVVGIRAEYIINSRWNVTNSLYSFHMARDWIQGPLFILNSDIIVHPDVIHRLLKHGGDCFAYDSHSGNGVEHMKVKLSDGELSGMGKDLDPKDVSGENVGILCLTQETAGKLLDRADELVKNNDGEKQWIGAAVNSIAKDVTITGVDVAGLPWGEIDFSYDLVRARKEVWPAIKRDMSRRTLPRLILKWTSIATMTLLLAHLVYRTWVSPTESAWGTMDLEAVQQFQIQSTAGSSKTWSRLEVDQQSKVHVTGPLKLQVETRLLIEKTETEGAPYVIEILIDGQRDGWHLKEVAPSKTWTCAEYAIGKRNRLRLEVPEGKHTVGIRLVAADSGACLVKIRQEEIETAVD